MGYLLLDRPNPNGQHFYTTRRERVLAIVVHVTAGSEDLDTLDDLSAENVANYAATTDRYVSWHTGSDSDSWVNLLPSSYTAWHATDYNSCTHGHEISKRTTDWRNVPAMWIEKTLRMAALGPDGHGGLRRKAIELGVPLRWATKAELDHARATGGAPVGFVTHAEVQWEDRRDPGYVTEGGRVIDTFPRDRFMQLLRQELNQNEDDTMNLLVKGKDRADCYIVSTTADGRWKRRIDGPELDFLKASGVTLHEHNQVDVDRIPDRSANAEATWNYGIPTEPGDNPVAFTAAHQLVANINQNTTTEEATS